jgi:hypothetical protein
VTCMSTAVFLKRVTSSVPAAAGTIFGAFCLDLEAQDECWTFEPFLFC